MISLIFTVLNEAQSLPALLDSIAMQTRKPDEVVICDGGSSDNTLAILYAEQQKQRFCLHILLEMGANISRGRNIAIMAAQGPIIACSDATAGFFLPDAHNTFEIAMSATVLPTLNEINAATFLPSSRSVAFLKTAWAQVQGYPEWLDYCEDLLFDFAIRAQCGGFSFAPNAIVYFRPRGSLRSFYKQYYLYARGDGKANLWLKRHLIRYAVYLIGLPAFILGGIGLTPWLWLGLLVGGLAYIKTPLLRLTHLSQWPTLAVTEKIKAFALIPIIRVVGDIAKMVGYPVGVWWRINHK